MTSPDARFSDCLDDPGELSGQEAIHAFSIHCVCAEGCLPRRRAEAAVDAEFVAEFPIWTRQNDEHFAERVRVAAHLAARRQHQRTPGPRPPR